MSYQVTCDAYTYSAEQRNIGQPPACNRDNLTKQSPATNTLTLARIYERAQLTPNRTNFTVHTTHSNDIWLNKQFVCDCVHNWLIVDLCFNLNIFVCAYAKIEESAKKSSEPQRTPFILYRSQVNQCILVLNWKIGCVCVEIWAVPLSMATCCLWLQSMTRCCCFRAYSSEIRLLLPPQKF